MSRRNQDRIDFHRNYSDHGRPSPTGSDDSYNGSSHLEKDIVTTYHSFPTIAFPTFDTPGSLFNDAPIHPHLNSTLPI